MDEIAKTNKSDKYFKMDRPVKDTLDNRRELKRDGGSVNHKGGRAGILKILNSSRSDGHF